MRAALCLAHAILLLCAAVVGVSAVPCTSRVLQVQFDTETFDETLPEFVDHRMALCQASESSSDDSSHECMVHARSELDYERARCRESLWDSQWHLIVSSECPSMAVLRLCDQFAISPTPCRQVRTSNKTMATRGARSHLPTGPPGSHQKARWAVRLPAAYWAPCTP
jgi:hypothetical protein